MTKTADAVKNTVDTVKTTVEKISTASNQAFKDGMEKTVDALNEVSTVSKSNVEAVVESFTAATKGVEAVSTQSVEFTKKQWEDAIANAKTLSSAKSIQEVVELQSKWAKSSMEAYVAQMNTVSELLSTSFKNVYSPINARVTATVEKFQSFK